MNLEKREGWQKIDQICMNIPGLVPWISSDKATSTTASVLANHAVWRDYILSEQRPLLNYFAVARGGGTNPLYGRGCSTGTLHAHLLSRCLAMNRILQGTGISAQNRRGNQTDI